MLNPHACFKRQLLYHLVAERFGAEVIEVL
jgi:hypothetical protein